MHEEERDQHAADGADGVGGAQPARRARAGHEQAGGEHGQNLAVVGDDGDPPIEQEEAGQDRMAGDEASAGDDAGERAGSLAGGSGGSADAERHQGGNGGEAGRGPERGGDIDQGDDGGEEDVAEDPAAVLSAGVNGDSGGEVALGHDAGSDRSAGRGDEHGEGGEHGERDPGMPDEQHARGRRGGQQHQQEEDNRVGAGHQPAAVEAVGEDAAVEHRDDLHRQLDRADDRDLGELAGFVEHPLRDRQEAELLGDDHRQRAGPEHPVVADREDAAQRRALEAALTARFAHPAHGRTGMCAILRSIGRCYRPRSGGGLR